MKGELIKEITPYRQIDALNQSKVCDFAESPLAFYKKHILKDNEEDESSFSLSIGTLTDFYVLECGGKDDVFNQRLDEQFVICKEARGTKQVFVLADELFKVAKRHMDENGIIQTEFTVMFQEAFSNIQNMKNAQGNPYYSGKDWKKALIDFNENGKEYYNTLISQMGKTVINEGILSISKRIKDQLFFDENLRHLFIDDGVSEILNKFPIEFEYRGWQCKAEIDKIKINHIDKTIHLYDLKCSWMNEGWELSYLKNKYYIQNAWYYLAAHEWVVENDMEEYTIFPMSFIVCDTTPNKMRPLIYETTKKHIDEGILGFTYKGKYNKGINQLLDELKWASNNSIWNITETNYKNKSIVKLRTFGE